MSVDHLADAMERLEAMDRTGLAQAFSAKNGSAVLAELKRLREERDLLHAGIEEYLLWRPGERGHADAHRQLAALSEASASRVQNGQETA